MLVKIILLLLFFGCMIAVGLYARKSANSMTDFVLGGRSVSAVAFGVCLWHILFSLRWCLWGTRDSLGGSMA